VNIRPARVVLLAITHDTKDYEMSARSESATTAAQRNGLLVVRSAEPADHEAIGGVVLDLGTHASYGRLLVAATPERVLGFAVFYPDSSVPDSGFPSGWAGVRVLAVYPGAGDADVRRALLGACERLAAEAGAPVLAIRTASIMTEAIAGHERLGYRRSPEFDGTEPVNSVAHSGTWPRCI
jgi:GNAT superfamily N-acetyltransferase